MGIKALGNPGDDFVNKFGRAASGDSSGLDAYLPAPSADGGIDATGGTIMEWYDPTPGQYYRVHIFEASGSFVVNSLATAPNIPDNVEFLLIAGGGGGETVTASVTNGVATLSGSDAGLINTLSEWIDAVSVDGVIKKAADDADAVGVVAFQLSGNTYLVESNDTFDNNTANVSIVTVIELTGLTGVNAVADAAAANTVLIA